MDEQLSRCQALEKYGYDVSTVVGVSMKPMLRSRKDVVYIEADKNLKPGDVGLFRINTGKYILHRLLRIENGTYVFRGDNCITCERVTQNEILGKLTKFWRGKKEISCEKSKGYKVYCFVWKYTYFLRYAAKKTAGILRRVLKAFRLKISN